MKLKNLLHDEEAVSPVIGVILMVAITVILAAVIGSFVLGLGSNVSTAPSASFSFEYNSGGDGSFGSGGDGDSVTISHDGGETIDKASITVLVAGSEVTSDSWPDTEVSAGDSYTHDEASGVNMQSGDDVLVTWSSQQSDKSSTLSSSTVP